MKESSEEFKPFHSAVNRIPVLRTLAQENDKLPDGLFADRPAPGHDHISPGHWSGSIDLEMTVRTPLVFGEQTKENGRSYIELPTDELGNPLIPATMVKGMISRAYENLTCSRFRVFGDHSEPLTYRASTTQANHLFAGSVYFDEEIKSLAVEVLNGTGERNEFALLRDRLDKGVGNICLTGHPSLNSRGTSGQADPEEVIKLFRELTPHGQWTSVKLARWRSGNKRLTMVTHVRNGDELEKFFDPPNEVGGIEEIEAKGFPCRTAPDNSSSAELYSDKKYEKFLFKVARRNGRWIDVAGTALRLPQEAIEGYERIVRSYVEAANQHGSSATTLNRAATKLGTSDRISLKPDDIVFLRLSDKTIRNTEGKLSSHPRVLEILPTMVGRRSYADAPHKLADNQKVTPPLFKDDASAADRLFGYVAPEANTGSAGGDVAARGRIVVGNVTVVGSPEKTISRDVKELTPLLLPKPSSARRFLTDSSGNTPLKKGEDGRPTALPRDELFHQGQLLGAAAYPVHRRLLEGKDLDCSGFPLEATKTIELNGRVRDNSAVRIKVRSWVKTGSVLRCTVSFSNLEKDELAALLWILTPENLVPPMEKKRSGGVGHLRMGLGKPLGLGAIEVRISPGGVHAIRGEDIARTYADLSGCLGHAEGIVSADIPLLDPEVVAELEQQPWVRAMQRAAFGYSSKTPVRYMTLEENSANNLTNPKTGDPKDGYGVSPVDMTGDSPPQPIYIKNNSPGSQHGSHKNGRKRGRP